MHTSRTKFCHAVVSWQRERHCQRHQHRDHRFQFPRRLSRDRFAGAYHEAFNSRVAETVVFVGSIDLPLEDARKRAERIKEDYKLRGPVTKMERL